MVKYKFKLPTLVELLLFIAVGFIVGFGLWLIVKNFVISSPTFVLNATAKMPITGLAQILYSWVGLQCVFIWLSLILLGIIAIELESMREHIMNLEEKVKEIDEKMRK